MENFTQFIDRMPENVEEVLCEGRTYERDCLVAVREFRSTKAWRGTVEERREKFKTLHAALREVYNLPIELEFVGPNEDGAASDRSCYDPRRQKIRMIGRLSVITYLHLIAAARGFTYRGRFGWSLNLFKRLFPRSFSRLRFEGCIARKSE